MPFAALRGGYAEVSVVAIVFFLGVYELDLTLARVVINSSSSLITWQSRCHICTPPSPHINAALSSQLCAM